MTRTDLPLLEARGLCLRAGSRELLRDLDLRVYAGERWVLLGPNGAGKSSLLAALAGVSCAWAGEVRLAGQPLAQLGMAQAARHRAWVADRWLDAFAASALETVLTARYVFGVEAEGAALAREMLALMDCAALAARDVREFSRGERQRVAIATALAQDTPLLLMDEPTAHQDPRHQAMVLARLAALPGRGFVAAMHDVNAAAHFATHALLLSGAGGWTAGPADQVLNASNLSKLFATEVRALGAGEERVFVARWAA